MNTHPQRRQQASKEGVDGNEKPDIIGGSQRRKPLEANDEAASATTFHFGETALKKGVDEADKPVYNGRLATTETSGQTEEGAEADSKVL
ncbi:hypothetical protein [Stenotrophomonas rhizophila]